MHRVFVHGFTQTASSWAPVAEQLRGTPGPDDARLVAVPGGLGFMATAHALDQGPGEYVGYSMGGRLCLQLALDRPDTVQRLVLVSASPGIADPAARASRCRADERLALEIERDGVTAFLDRWIAQPLFASLPRERSGIDERARDNTVATLTHQLRALGQGAQPSNWERLRELAVPVLLVVGSLDTKYVAVARHMAGEIPGARLEVVGGAGHACHLEQPENVAHLLATW